MLENQDDWADQKNSFSIDITHSSLTIAALQSEMYNKYYYKNSIDVIQVSFDSDSRNNKETACVQSNEVEKDPQS